MSDSKVWFITGAARGMGVDIVHAALAAGHSVVAAARDAARVTEVFGEQENLLPVALDITDENGKVINYTIEMASPGLMVRQGFNRNRFKVGDKVVFKVHPSKTGAPVGECLFNCDVTINGVKAVPPATTSTP